MRWTIPALNPNELQVLVAGMKKDPPPNRFADIMRLAEGLLPDDRWARLQAQVGG